MRIEIYGASDDLIEVRVDGKNKDEFGGYIEGNGRYSRSLRVASIGGARAVRVHAIYDGCWSFAVGQIEDGRSLPGWSFVTEQEHAYSAKLVIVTGDDPVTVVLEERAKGRGAS